MTDEAHEADGRETCPLNWAEVDRLNARIDEAQKEGEDKRNDDREFDRDAKMPKYYPDRGRFRILSQEELESVGVVESRVTKEEAE